MQTSSVASLASRFAPLLLLGLVACGGSTSPDGGGGGTNAGRTLALGSGSGQTGTVGAALPAPLVVKVTKSGAPVPNVAVTFTVTAGGGTLSAPSATTNATGDAQVTWTLGQAAGTGLHVVGAVLAGATGSPVSFAATATADAPSVIAADSLTVNQAGVPNQAVPQPIAVLVRDRFGNGVPGVTVAWTVATGGGTLAAPTSVTNDAGRATVVWTLGSALGAQSVTASVAAIAGSAPLTFRATASNLRITAFNADTLVEGQSVTLTGEGFSATASNLLLTIGAASATITSSSPTSITFTVPAACRPRGPVSVVVSNNGLLTPAVNQPFRPSQFFSLAVGQQAIIADPTKFCLQFDTSSATESYLVGVLNTTESASSVLPVALTSASTAPAARIGSAFFQSIAVPLRGGNVDPTAARSVTERLLARHMASHAAVREMDRRLAASARASRSTGSTTGSVGTVSAIPTPAGGFNVGDTVANVRYLQLDATLCSQFVPLKTVVRAVGTRGIWLEDVTNPTNGFAPADWQASSELFDSQLYAKDVENWGEPSDVDGNGKVFIVTTRKINEYNASSSGGVLAFVRSVDLLPSSGPNGCTGSNFGEIYYALAPDPSNQTGYSITVDRAKALQGILIAHEFTHIIQNGRRLSSPSLNDWEAEGGATLSEQLVGFSIEGRAPNADLGLGPAFSFDAIGTAQPTTWYTNVFGDAANFYGFICVTRNTDGTCATYGKAVGAPEQCSFLASYSTSGAPCSGGRALYGIPSLLLRYVADQAGPTYPGGVTKLLADLIGSGQVGLANVAARAGVAPDVLLARFYAALYVDGRVSGLDPRLQFTTWNMFDIFEGTFVDANGVTRSIRPQARLVPATRGFATFSDNLTVRGFSNSYTIVSGAGRSPTAIRATQQDGLTALPASARMWVVRLQ